MEAKARGETSSLGWVVAGLAVAAIIVAFVVHRLVVERELQALPPAQQQSLYQRTLDTLRTTCEQPVGPNLEDYCREQADLLADMPECDDACQTLVQQFSPKPSR